MTIDRRIARTRNALWLALMENLRHHDWDAINVRMICEVADVARSSFYAHFHNKAALLDFGFEQVLSEVQELVSQTHTAPGELQTINWLVDHIHQNRVLFDKFSKSTSDQMVFARFKAAATQMLTLELAGLNQNTSPDAVHFVIGGCF